MEIIFKVAAVFVFQFFRRFGSVFFITFVTSIFHIFLVIYYHSPVIVSVIKMGF